MCTIEKIRIRILVFSLLFIASEGISQTEEVKVRFISNCGLHMTDGTTNIYIDFPYRSGAFIYDEFDSSELDSIQDSSIFLFTHAHGDHYSRKNMRYVMKHKNGKKYGKWNIDSLTVLEKEISNFQIEATKTIHKFSKDHYSYLITWHGKRIFISGDAESTETVATMKDLDVAFIPWWIWLSLHEENIELDTKMMAVYHIGPKDSVKIIHPKVIVLDEQGEVITIP